MVEIKPFKGTRPYNEEAKNLIEQKKSSPKRKFRKK